MPTMPNVVGLELGTAQAALQAAGVLVLGAIGYFGTYPVSVSWRKSASPPLTVLSQSINSGNSVAANAALTLGVAQPPMAVVFP
jgi:hypothetical protein